MPATLAYGFHESNRGEYLAQFFLCALGVSAPVIRQEDIGVDFFCSIAKEENKKLTFHSPFMVQQGAEGSKEFIYGGYSKQDTNKEKWRKEGIEWLFSQELPLFVCVTNRKEGRVRLYSTSAMWLARYAFGDMNEVELCPDLTHDPIKECRGDKIGIDGHGDGYSYRVPLGNPIVELDILNFDDGQRAKAIESLTLAVDLEQKNITFRRLGVHVASWFTDVRPNDPESLRQIGRSVSWDGGDSKNVPTQVASLQDIAVTLALNLQARAGQFDEQKLDCLAPIFRLFDPSSIPDWTLSQLPNVVRANLNSEPNLVEGAAREP